MQGFGKSGLQHSYSSYNKKTMHEEKKNMYEDLLIRPDEEGIRLAAEMLLRGSIVAFPTETVVSG